MEGFCHDLRDVIGVGDQERMLGDRRGDADDVGLLERVGADHLRVDLTGDGHHGDRVHMGVGQRGHQIGGPGSGGGEADPYLPGDHGIALGGMPAALLMADEHMVDPLRVHERVIGGQDRPARDPEHIGDAELLQAADDRLGAGDLLGRHSAAWPVEPCIGGGGRQHSLNPYLPLHRRNPGCRSPWSGALVPG